MASAQNLLGFCFFACASETLFSWVWPGGLQASKSYVALCLAWGASSNLSQPFFFVFSRFQKQRFGTFLAAVSYGSGTILLSFWAHYTSFFLMGSKSDVSAFFWLRLGNGFGTKPAGALLFRMRSRRSFLGLCLVAAVSQWLGHDFIVFRGSKSDVSAFFWLRFRNGFGTKPAGVLLFRMRVRNTFFLSLAWWLAGFQVLRCAVPCLRQPFATFFLCF